MRGWAVGWFHESGSTERDLEANEAMRIAVQHRIDRLIPFDRLRFQWMPVCRSNRRKLSVKIPELKGNIHHCAAGGAKGDRSISLQIVQMDDTEWKIAIGRVDQYAAIQIDQGTTGGNIPIASKRHWCNLDRSFDEGQVEGLLFSQFFEDFHIPQGAG